jgi:hypothetical protein
MGRCHIQTGVEFRKGLGGTDTMRSIGLLLIIPALAWGVGSAYAPPGQSSASGRLTTPDADLATGTTICATLAKPIDAKKVKPGEAIAARVTLPVLSHGKVLIPNDAKIIGHVTLAKIRAPGGTESELAIVFDRAVLKDGSQLPLALTVQAIGNPTLPAAAIADQEAANADPIGRIPAGPPSTTPRQPGSGSRSPSTNPSRTPAPDADSPGLRHPTLDASNHGAIGLPDLTLTESSDAASGSVVRSPKNDVKLESGTELILRVVGSPGSSDSTSNQ